MITIIETILGYIPGWMYAIIIAALGALVTVDTVRIDGDNATIANLKVAIADGNAKAAQQSAELSNQILKAQNDAKTREIDLRNTADSAKSESDGLRNDSAILRKQLDQLSRNAVIERASAIDAVLSDCAADYQRLAASCDRHVSDIETLIEAWPKK